MANSLKWRIRWFNSWLKGFLSALQNGELLEFPQAEIPSGRSPLYYASKSQLQRNLRDRLFKDDEHVGVYQNRYGEIAHISFEWPLADPEQFTELFHDVLDVIWHTYFITNAHQQRMNFRIARAYDPYDGYTPVFAISVKRNKFYIEVKHDEEAGVFFDHRNLQREICTKFEVPVKRSH